MGNMTVFSDVTPERFVSGGTSDVSFGHFFAMVRRRRWSVLITFAALMAASVVVLFNLTPKYTAQALITLNMKEEADGIAGILSGGIVGKDTAEIGSAINALMSPGAVEQVVAKLDLQHDPEFDPLLAAQRSWRDRLPPWLGGTPAGARAPVPAPTTEAMRLQTVAAVSKRLSVTNDGKSYTISVAFTSREAASAALIANAFGDWFIQHRKDFRSRQLDQISGLLMEKSETLRDRVAKSEMSVTAYREAHNIIDIGNQSTLNVDALTKLNTELMAARGTEAAADANLQELERFARDESPEAAAQLAGTSPTLGSLVEQRNQLNSQIAALSQTLLGSHPTIKSLKSRLAEVNAELDAETKRLLAGLRAKLQVARTSEAKIRGAMSQLTTASQQSARAGSELKQLESERDAARTVYQSYLESTGHLGVEASAQAFDAEVTSAALPPLQPTFPQTTLMLGLSAFCSALLAIGAAILLESLHRGVYSEADVAAIHGARVLGMVPHSSRKSMKGQSSLSLKAVKEPLSAHAEAIRSIGVTLTAGHGGSARKVVLVASALPGEGKTSIALSLARLTAAAGKSVMLLECDLRRPTLHRSLRSTNVGLAEVLNGTVKLGDAIQLDQESGLRFICAGSNAAYPGEMLSSHAMESVIKKARATYDLVIIDTPPIGIVSDALVLSTRADSTVVVVRSGKTDKRAFSMALDRLSQIGTTVTGVVLNHVAPREVFKYASKREIRTYLASPS